MATSYARSKAIGKDNDMVKRWAVPIIATLIGYIWGGAIIGQLAGILTALIWPWLAEWLIQAARYRAKNAEATA